MWVMEQFGQDFPSSTLLVRFKENKGRDRIVSMEITESGGLVGWPIPRRKKALHSDSGSTSKRKALEW